MEVEVVFPEVCGAFYKCSLIDVNMADGKCYVVFENNWKPSGWVELAHARFPPQIPTTTNLNPGTRVEALLPHNEGEPAGWWIGTVTKSKGEVAGVQFTAGGDQYTDLVEHKNLRVPNSNPPLSNIKFYQKEFPAPAEIQDFCRNSKVHQNFRDKVRALSVSYDSDKASLVVLADNQDCLDRAEVLIDIHFSDLTTQANLLSRTERAAQRLQDSHKFQQADDEGPSSVIEERFTIPQECVGFAMGKQGWNVNQARQIEGIISIEFEDYRCMFIVKAETTEAAKEARRLLEFTREVVHVQRDLAGKVIGRGGNIIQQILEKARLNSIKVIGDDEARTRGISLEHSVPFEMLGRRKAIEHARLILDYHLEHLKEVDNIIQSQNEITRKLMDSSLQDEQIFHPRPGGRGRGRGRWRGRGGYGRGGRSRNTHSGSYSEEERQQKQHGEDEDNEQEGSEESPSTEEEEEEREEEGSSASAGHESPVERNQPSGGRRRPPGRGGRGGRRGYYQRGRGGRRGRGRGGGGGGHEPNGPTGGSEQEAQTQEQPVDNDWPAAPEDKETNTS